ncbi:MAG: hypothetical protein M1118_14925 [Chloroflexi bacterium]|nr:hypothetical protein [Chloroflexota bacterium]
MNYVAGFFAFWYDFIVGDDWTVAAGVLVALLITALLVHAQITAWWLMPLAVLLLMTSSLWRATHAK